MSRDLIWVDEISIWESKDSLRAKLLFFLLFHVQVSVSSKSPRKPPSQPPSSVASSFSCPGNPPLSCPLSVDEFAKTVAPGYLLIFITKQLHFAKYFSAFLLNKTIPQCSVGSEPQKGVKQGYSRGQWLQVPSSPLHLRTNCHL